MVVPLPAMAPVMLLPETAPIVQVKLEVELAFNTIFVLVPLQIVLVLGADTTGVGLTVTVIIYGVPIQVPDLEVGVTKYCTVPKVELFGFVKIWLIKSPEPAVAPVIPFEIVPIAQIKSLEAVAVSAILVVLPLQIVAVLAVVTTGIGLTVTLIVSGVPAHEPTEEVGVTI